MNVWDHLPNAKLIDRVLADLSARPLVWNTALDADRDAAWATARDAARDAAWATARDAARDAARSAAWAAARDAAWAAARAAAWAAARHAAWHACVALIAWPEESAVLLDMPVDAVRLLAASGHHPAVLMLPACIALNGDTSEPAGPTT